MLPGQLLPLTQEEIEEARKFIKEHLACNTIQPHPTILEPLRSKLLLC